MSVANSPVVVIEDNEMNARLLEYQLKHLGFDTVVCFADAALALEWLTGNDCVLILTDWQMFPMNGDQFVREYRAWEARRGMRRPVIAVTAGAMACDYEQCMAAGVDDYLTKPLGLDRLRSTLLKWGLQ